MKVYPVDNNHINVTNKTIGKHNTNISFNGFNKTTLLKQAKNAANRTNTALYLMISSLFIILANIFDNKENIINSAILDMQNEYLNNFGNIENFNEGADEIKRTLEKRTIKKDYGNFAKEAITFLQSNFKQSQTHYKKYSRLKPFNNDNIKFVKFMDTINKSMHVAITRHSNFDIVLLDQNIQSAREIIQKGSNKI